MIRVAVLTVSTSRSVPGSADEGGDELVAFARGLGGEVVAREVVSDERAEIEERLREWSDGGGCDLILTTGGTGVAPRDVTPEATLAVIEREVPGIAEAMRDASREHTRHWMLSRGVAGHPRAHADRQLPGQPAQHRPDRRRRSPTRCRTRWRCSRTRRPRTRRIKSMSVVTDSCRSASAGSRTAGASSARCWSMPRAPRRSSRGRSC